MDIKKFNDSLEFYFSRAKVCNRPTRASFMKACEEQGLEPFWSDAGHMIASDGETYGDHAIITPRGCKAKKGNWGSLAEARRIKEIWPMHE